MDTGDSRLQNCVLRSVFLWCTGTVCLPTGKLTRASVQWFQLDPSTSRIVQRGLVDDSANVNFYAYPVSR